MKTVAVIEGFSGGPVKTRRFRRALSNAGFKVIKNRRQADIVVAHSAGIYAVPMDSKADLLMLIGPTYWPGKSLFARMLKHTRDSRRFYTEKFGRRYYLRKKALEFYYFFTRNKYLWLGIIHNNRIERLKDLSSKPGRITIIVVNQDDAYSSREVKDKIKSDGMRFAELPGIHDDYYENPKPYIDLLLKNI